MAQCVSISSGLLGACDYKLAGTDKIYIGNYDDFSFSKDANQVVTAITATSGATFFEFEAELNTGSGASALQIGGSGNKYFQQTVNFSNANNTSANLEVLKDLGLSKVVAIVVTRDQVRELYGEDGGLRAITLEYNTGAAEGDASGYNVSLQGVGRQLRSIVSDSVTIPV
jgi:hypothetical protein